MTINEWVRQAKTNILFTANTTIFREGERQRRMYQVLDGTVDLFVRDSRIATVEAGGILGELSMLMRQPRSATAIARTDCMLAPLDTQQFTAGRRNAIVCQAGDGYAR
jgi:CRP-like cAMP-binding protein